MGREGHGHGGCVWGRGGAMVWSGGAAKGRLNVVLTLRVRKSVARSVTTTVVHCTPVPTPSTRIARPSADTENTSGYIAS